MFNSCSIKETPVGREYSELSVFQLEKVTAGYYPPGWGGRQRRRRKPKIEDGRGPRLKAPD